MGILFFEFKNENKKTNTTTTALAEWESEKTDSKVIFICPKCKSGMSLESIDAEELESFYDAIRSFKFCPSCGIRVRE